MLKKIKKEFYLIKIRVKNKFLTQQWKKLINWGD